MSEPYDYIDDLNKKFSLWRFLVLLFIGVLLFLAILLFLTCDESIVQCVNHLIAPELFVSSEQKSVETVEPEQIMPSQSGNMFIKLIEDTVSSASSSIRSEKECEGELCPETKKLDAIVDNQANFVGHCPESSSNWATCNRTCDLRRGKTCTLLHTNDDGRECFVCKTVVVESKEGVTEQGALKIFVSDDGELCPEGTIGSKAVCEQQCSGAVCIDNGKGCFSCLNVQCPEGTFKNECPDSCTNGCEIVAEGTKTMCYDCKKSCEETCADNGFAQVGTDWSEYIESFLQDFECVSGNSVSMAQRQVGECICTQQPTITIDEIVPVCAGTPCGDVQCGETKTCALSPQTNATVACPWGGWRQIDVNKFQPVIGEAE